MNVNYLLQFCHTIHIIRVLKYRKGGLAGWNWTFLVSISDLAFSFFLSYPDNIDGDKNWKMVANI